MNLKELKKRLMKDPEFKKEYERFDLWFEIQQFWLDLRCRWEVLKSKFNQKEEVEEYTTKSIKGE